MKYSQPHIKIELNRNEEIIIVIDDFELYDYIDDYLTENCNIEYEYRREYEDSEKGITYHELNFGNKYSFKKLQNAIKKLNYKELERIYKLNN